MFCPNCGAQNDDNAEFCVKCELNLKTPSQLIDKNESVNLSSVVPIGRTGLSIVSGYLGLCALVPPLAPIALVVSIIAWVQFQKNPGKLGKGRIIFGLIAGSIGTAALVYLLLVKGRIMY
jgi:hypothetical protein